MPLTELERHPYLHLQLQSPGFKFEKIKILIVGTSPIYAIMDSDPIDNAGIYFRQNYKLESRFKYFYGSIKNNFWEILSKSLNHKMPANYLEAIELLNSNNIFLTDVISETYRKNYSSQDKDLKKFKLNHSLLAWVNKMESLKDIIFTSVDAKKWFCKLFNLKFSKIRLQSLTFDNREFNLVILPTPAGNGRSVCHYYNIFPLNTEEALNKSSGKGFALQYRQRLYSEALNNRQPNLLVS